MPWEQQGIKTITMKLLLVALTLSISIPCFSQSKSDTETWILDNLNETFNLDFVSYNENGGVLSQANNFTHYEINGSLLICKNQYFTGKGDAGKFEKELKTTIDLKRVGKLQIDTSTTRLTGVVIYNYTVRLVCNEPIDFNNPPIKQYDEKGTFIKNGTYSLIYNIKSGKLDATKNNLVTRIVAAFTHLIELNGGKIKKEVF